GRFHNTGGSRAHRRTTRATEVNASVHRGAMAERIDTHAEARRHVELAGDRLAERHVRQCLAQVIDLRSCDIDAVDLALERGSMRGRARWDKWSADARDAGARPRRVRLHAKIGEHAT